ncbi:hypothetical protein Aph01nite_43300 [Acrocarpospora phusangensis]|uniref:Uncharacterized protein n=1 Tax=Acrocarpospora phusangensis TaxID=1070424 RepID=A0A919QGG5_9ACTN|nr:hypothetical protein [Acrocarpospora phusangensis]GIH26020.1 hypothetical protein Aph01nite_43300 [Acrocarpospora phusangensis]
MTIPAWIVWAGAYFAVVGLVAHLVLGGLGWLARADSRIDRREQRHAAARHSKKPSAPADTPLDQADGLISDTTRGVTR